MEMREPIMPEIDNPTLDDIEMLNELDRGPQTPISDSNPFFKEALNYLQKGLNVIPVRPDKKPHLKWEKYQTQQVTEDEVREWWQKWPRANIACVTGQISGGLYVLDADSKQGLDKAYDLMKDAIPYPMSNTPNGGTHCFFTSKQKHSNSTRFIQDCDFRGDGGYIVLAPSKGNNGKHYSWLKERSLFDIQPPELPEPLIAALKATSKRLTQEDMTFKKGTRDEDLFHTALNLFKGGASKEEVEKTILNLAATCSPPFSPKEALVKVQSAYDRFHGKGRNLTQDIRDWIELSEGEFQTRDINEELNIPKHHKAKVSVILSRLLQEGLTERTGKRTGCFRRIDKKADLMDIYNTPDELVDLLLPFCIHELVEIRPGNIIVVAGTVNSGKTAILLNIVRDNLDKFSFHYFNSEMGAGELRLRVKNFKDTPFEAWKDVKFKERYENFHDVIVPGKGNVNVIDFLELTDEFYLVNKRITQIHRKLDGAIAIIAIQKNPGVKVPLGGYRGLEKCRLAISIESGTMEIIKAKNWRTEDNPNGKKIRFKLAGGCNLFQVDHWSLD